MNPNKKKALFATVIIAIMMSGMSYASAGFTSIWGANNGNNNIDTSLVQPNPDGSILERLEDIVRCLDDDSEICPVE